jgi:hypothetical protein
MEEQLKQRYIRQKLASACCVLLSSAPGLTSAQAQDTSTTTNSEPELANPGLMNPGLMNPWLMNIGLANFVERERNTGIELIVNGERAIGEDRINIKAEIDVITGATPNGATASNVPQTFTMSSGIGEYTVAANELPADDTHMDIRMGINVLYDQAINNNFRIDYSSHLSMEFDYLSMGFGLNLKHDFNQHNTTLILGYNYEYNRVHPVGGIPIPLASMQPAGALQPRDVAAKTKRVDGFSLGLSQVLTATSFLQLKYSYSDASGYLSDPYKLLSVIEDGSGNTLDYIYESRPGAREMQSVYLSNKTFLSGDVLDLSYRYYWDEWDIRSNTINIRYRRKLADQHFLQPRLRYYSQSAASFFSHSLPDSSAIPVYASADFRMAKFDAYTIGFKYGKQTGKNKIHSISIDYYTQIGENHPSDAIGLQKQQDLFPTLQTIVLFYNYAFHW